MNMNTLDEMLAMVQAAKSVPNLEATIIKYKAALDHKDKAFGDIAEELTHERNAKADLEAKLASLEVERDAYGFRAIDAEDKLAKLGSILGVGVASDVKVSDAEGGSPQTTSSVDQPLSDSLTEAEGPITGDTVVEDNTTGGEGTASPTVSSTKEPESANAQTTSVESQVSADTSISDKPYTDRNYWDKPSDMTWRVWHRHGGPLPHWLDVSFHDLDSTN